MHIAYRPSALIKITVSFVDARVRERSSRGWFGNKTSGAVVEVFIAVMGPRILYPTPDGSNMRRQRYDTVTVTISTY